MERYSSYEAFIPAQEIESQYKPGFESYTHIFVQELEPIRLPSVEEKAKTAQSSKAERGPEALWHAESQTLVVPPPSGSEGDMTAKDLAEMAVPVAGFIKKTQPDIVVGCDRGGRLYSLAVYSLWGERHPKNRFPTLDSKLHFARLSTSVHDEAMDESVARIVEQSRQQAKMTGKSLNGESPRILFIDDWISSGATREHILGSLDRLGLQEGIDVNFAVMCGGKADASGGDVDKSVPWHDDPTVIGVDYARGSPEARPVRTKAARKVRKDIHSETHKLATKIKVNKAAGRIGKALIGKR